MISIEAAAAKIEQLKNDGMRIGLCHGGFDLMHPGHIIHFNSARSLCDKLFVSVSEDQTVSHRKGNSRPVFPAQVRAYSIANLECVDAVLISPGLTAVDLLRQLKPTLYIKGPDYANKGANDDYLRPEIETVRSFGGDIRYTSDPNLSTTEIISHIKSLE
jgi:rfaE bifunctional protein nucleotidyltransferase chain/domain